MTYTTTISYNDLELEVTYWYKEGIKSNDYDVPDDDDDFEVEKIEVSGNDITEIIDETSLERIKEMVYSEARES